MKKKCEIITLHAVRNYGSVLQAYATQRIIEDLGFEAELVDYRREAILTKSVSSILTNKGSIFGKFKSILMLPSSKKANIVFEKFISANLKLTDKRYTYDKDFVEYPIVADYYITGSDQVWNTEWHDEIPKPFYWDNIPNNNPRIAFSASFGKSKLDDWEKEETKALLERYDAISVRELSGVDILFDLGINNGIQVMDPTQIVSPKVWYEMAASKVLPFKYILIYQLCNNSKFDEFAVKLAKKKGLKLIRLCTRYDQRRKPGHGIVLPQIEEFLSLINHAEYVLTDSFHATSYSLIFHKKFLSFYPNRFGTRLESILELVNLKHKLLTDFNNFNEIDSEIDYQNVDDILDKKRKEGIDFLKKALKI